MPRRCSEEFSCKVAAGRPIAEIAHDLQVSDHTVYGWRKQGLIDVGKVPGLSRLEQAELTSAKRGIREPANEVAILKWSSETLKEPHDEKAIHGHSDNGRGRFSCAGVLSPAGVSVAGYCEWRNRPPSLRALRYTWLLEQITAVHAASRGTYGARRIHAELTLGLGLSVEHNHIDAVMP